MNMKSTKRTSKTDPLAPRRLDWSKAVRAKYFERYNEGTNIAVIDPDLMETYPDSKAVNEALRTLRDVKAKLDGLTTRTKKNAA